MNEFRQFVVDFVTQAGAVGVGVWFVFTAWDWRQRLGRLERRVRVLEGPQGPTVTPRSGVAT